MKEPKQTVKDIRLAMQRKIEDILPEFERMPLSQRCTSTQGEEVDKVNPALQEARALFRDFCFIAEKEMNWTGEEVTDNKIEDIRARFKVAK